jgi:hypothetical protein
MQARDLSSTKGPEDKTKNARERFVFEDKSTMIMEPFILFLGWVVSIHINKFARLIGTAYY